LVLFGLTSVNSIFLHNTSLCILLGLLSGPKAAQSGSFTIQFTLSDCFLKKAIFFRNIFLVNFAVVYDFGFIKYAVAYEPEM